MTTKPKTTTTGDYGAKDITFWESDLDKIRARPQMYIGSTDGATGIFSVVRECLDNGVDEFQAGHAKVLDIVVADDYATYTIKDDGRGIPVAMHPVAKKPTLTVVLSYLQTSGKINAGKGKAYENSIGCFTGDTKIKLLSGKSITFDALYKDWPNEPNHWVYSIDPKTGKRTFGKITHVQLSKYVKKLAVVTLNNGKRIKSTVDHPYYTNEPDGSIGKVEASKLRPGTSLASLYLYRASNGYIGFRGGKAVGVSGISHLQKMRHVHRAVYEQEHGKLPIGYHLHHKDENKENNHPNNIGLMTAKEHLEHHGVEKAALMADLNTQLSVRLKQHKSKIHRILARLWYEDLKPTAANYKSYWIHGAPGWEPKFKSTFYDLVESFDFDFNADPKAFISWVSYAPTNAQELGIRANALVLANKSIVKLGDKAATMRNVNATVSGAVRQWAPYSLIMGWMSPKELLRLQQTGNCSVYADLSLEARSARMLKYESKTWTDAYIDKSLRAFAVWGKRANPKNWADVEQRKPKNIALTCKIKYMLELSGVRGSKAMREWLNTFNYSVKSVDIIEVLSTPVYGITVDDDHTYAIEPGVFVANTHGVGAKATNALSDKFTAITCNSGKWFKTEFAKGKEKLKPTACKAPVGMKRGTLISFSPDVSVFKKHANTVPQISAWADLTSRLNPGIRIRLTHKGKTKEWFEPGGIKSLVESRAVKLEAVPIGKLFEYHSSHMDLALSFTNAEGDLIDAYTNTVKNAEGGVHLNALRSALYDVLKAYLRKGEKMTPHDLLEGVIGVLNYKIAAPRFDSQTKEKLVDERVGDACRTECIEALQAFFDKNKKMADQIVLQAVQLREATNEFRKNKELTRKLKVAKKSKILLPDKLTASLKCAPDKRELYAVEGDSAAGTAKQARFNDFQEVFALRGKFMNAMRSTANQLFASDEVIGILQAIGYNPDVKDPMAHLRIGKLLWLADADADGAHINALGLTLLYKILPEMFDEGMVYVVVGSEFVGKTDDGKLLYADSLNELKALNGGKLPKNAKQLKGWGAATPTDLREMAFDPKTRRLLKVMPPKDGGDEFALLMEDNVEYRRKLLGV